MSKKKSPPPPPPRPGYSKQIKAMEPGDYLFLVAAPADSIKSIAWRIGDKMKRKYITQRYGKKPSGVQVWRTQ